MSLAKARHVMRALVLAVAMSACGGPAETGSMSDVDSTEERSDAAGESPSEPEPAEYGSQPDPVPVCLYFEPEAVERFPGLRDATHNAAARWRRWYPEGGENCSIRIRVKSGIGATAKTATAPDHHRIRLNPNANVIDGDTCTPGGTLLVDVLSHELGHAFGMHHSHCEGCAMRPRDEFDPCEPMVPTTQEWQEANGCGTWGPPAVGDCP